MSVSRIGYVRAGAAALAFAVALAAASPAYAAGSTCFVNDAPVTSTNITGTSGPDVIDCPRGVDAATTVDGAGGVDLITIEGRNAGTVTASGTITISSAQAPANSGFIIGSPDADHVTVHGGNAGLIILSEGDDDLTITGASPGAPANSGGIDLGHGADTLSLTGGAGAAGNAGAVNAGDGDDRLSAYGGPGGPGNTGQLQAGRQNDRVDVYGGDAPGTSGAGAAPGNTGDGKVLGGEGDDQLDLYGGKGSPVAASNTALVDGEDGTDTCGFLPDNTGTVTSCEER